MATFTTDEKVQLLLKSSLGKPTTGLDLEFYSEPSVANSRPGVLTSQIYADEIPSTRPADGWNTGVADTTLASYISGMSDGDTLNHGTYNIQYVHKATLSIITPGNHISYRAMSGETNLLQFSVPFNLDETGGYGMQLYRSTGSPIFDGEGDWLVDNNTGVLTFFEYSTVQSYVSDSLRPKLSFFRYTGSFGLSSFSSLWVDSTNEIYHTAKTVCVGRTTTSSPGSFDFECQSDAKFHSTVFAHDIVAESDIRLKKDIEVIKDPIKKLQLLRGVEYRWKDTNRKAAGLLAQDVESVLPQSVCCLSEKDGLLGVKYNHICGLLVECLKKQQEQLQEQKERIQRLEERLKDLD